LLQGSTQPITTTRFRRHVYGYDAAGRRTNDRTYLVVVTKPDGSFVTILKGRQANYWFQQALPR
jgi:hypothetical protein